MKVLLTGANGFVGSHILDALLARNLPTAILLRQNANTRLISSRLDSVEIRHGSLADLNSLRKAVEGITHVIHCAGCTRSLIRAGFFECNEQGTRNLLNALKSGGVQRFAHISSLAAAGPATSDAPAREDIPANPVSAYGESKLAAERVVRDLCPDRHLILRPPAVYGPRDGEFLRLFKAVQNHLRPRPPKQQLSLVYVEDLSRATVEALMNPSHAVGTYNVACAEVTTAREMAGEIARQVGAWTVPIPLPNAVFFVLCAAQECVSRVTGQASVLNMQKYAELRAPGWVCSTSKIQRELEIHCPTNLRTGIHKTLAWYREHRWL